MSNPRRSQRLAAVINAHVDKEAVLTQRETGHFLLEASFSYVEQLPNNKYAEHIRGMYSIDAFYPRPVRWTTQTMHTWLSRVAPDYMQAPWRLIHVTVIELTAEQAALHAKRPLKRYEVPFGGQQGSVTYASVFPLQ